jgi:hypothetical protein
MEECHRVLALTATGTWQDRNSINIICDGVVSALGSSQNQTALQELVEQYPALQQASPVSIFQQVRADAGRPHSQNYDPLDWLGDRAQKSFSMV